MSQKPKSTSVQPSPSGTWYRGVKLQPLANSPRTSLTRLQKAVKDAVAKNADALAGGK